MKQIIVKLVIFLPILLFIDWIIMIVVGCASNLCGANIIFFSTIYYYFGVILLILTFLFIGVVVYKQHVHQKFNIQ
jgi:hypothetical protein